MPSRADEALQLGRSQLGERRAVPLADAACPLVRWDVEVLPLRLINVGSEDALDPQPLEQRVDRRRGQLSARLLCTIQELSLRFAARAAVHHHDDELVRLTNPRSAAGQGIRLRLRRRRQGWWRHFGAMQQLRRRILPKRSDVTPSSISCCIRRSRRAALCGCCPREHQWHPRPSLPLH